MIRRMNVDAFLYLGSRHTGNFVTLVYIHALWFDCLEGAIPILTRNSTVFNAQTLQCGKNIGVWQYQWHACLRDIPL